MKKKTKAQLKDIAAEQLNRAKETKRRGKEAVKNIAASEDAYSYMMGGPVEVGYKMGGSVRGCSSSQVKGRGFKGTY